MKHAPESAQRVHLVEPHAGGRISGGYLYNQRISRGSAELGRHAVHVEALERELARVDFGEGGLVLIDSLFLTSRHAPPFVRLRRNGLRVGVLMHAFPSFIERAGDREWLSRALPLVPTLDELALLEQLDLLVAPGPYLPRLLIECGSSISSVICPPGVDRPLAEPAARPPSSVVRLLSIGNVTPLKGFADALQALAQVSGSFSWSIVGDVRLAPLHVASLRQLAEDHGLGASVHFLGARSHAETLSELERADLLLLSSHTENHPLVALEALAAGVPVVGYAVGGLPDIIRHGQTGLLAPLLDVGSLANHLNCLINDVEQRQLLSRGCVSAARSLMSWEQAAQHFRVVLQREAARLEA